MAEEVVIGIDIGGSLTKIGLVTSKGKILEKKIILTESHLPFTNFKKRLQKEVELLRSKIEPSTKILHLGVGAPNANPLTGNMENPPNLKWGKRIPLKRSFKNIFKLPVTIANDANAAALGEMMFGVAKGMRNFVVLTLGTGLGSGIIVNGKLLVGEHGAAGEIGHVNVEPIGRSCNCGLRGCLETYVSVTGIRRTIFELLATMNIDSIMRTYSFEELNGENISDAALEGDRVALRAFEQTGEILGRKMADTVAHLDPEAFILAGGLSKAGDVLLNPIKKSMEKNLFIAYKGKIKVLLSKATRSDAVLGPAALAWRAVEKESN